MLEHLYHEHVQLISGSQDSKGRNKRRKVEVITPTMAVDGDDDDDIYPTNPIVGKKSKVGIGYAGEVKEDVRESRLRRVFRC